MSQEHLGLILLFIQLPAAVASSSNWISLYGPFFVWLISMDACHVTQIRKGKSDNRIVPAYSWIVGQRSRAERVCWVGWPLVQPLRLTDSSSSFRNHEMLLETKRSNSNSCRSYITIKGHLQCQGFIGKFNRPILHLQGQPRQHSHFACHFAIFPIGYFNWTQHNTLHFLSPHRLLTHQNPRSPVSGSSSSSTHRSLRVNSASGPVVCPRKCVYFDHNRQINQCANRVLWSRTTRSFLCGNDAAKNGAQVGIVVRVGKDVQVLAGFRRFGPFARGHFCACSGFRCRWWCGWWCKWQWPRIQWLQWHSAWQWHRWIQQCGRSRHPGWRRQSLPPDVHVLRSDRGLFEPRIRTGATTDTSGHGATVSTPLRSL